MHVLEMILFWARARPNYPAIIQSDMVISYGGLAAAIQTVSERIADLNLDPRQPVGVAIEHPAKALVTTFALLHQGFTPALAYRRLLPFLRAAGVDNLIHFGEGQVLSGGRNIRFDDGWLPRGPLPKLVGQQRRADYPDIIFFSSGTTGLPKKCIHTNRGFLERLKRTVLREIEPATRPLIVPSVASSFGFNLACELFYMGKTACFALPGEMTLTLISSYHIDAVFASPQQVLGMVDLIEKGTDHYPLDSLKSVLIGGGFISKALARRIQARLCPQITVTYASTEAGFMAITNYDAIADVPNAAGYVLPWVELQIVDDAGAVLPPDTEGYIRCRTPTFLQSLAANNPDAKNETQESWWYSGDLGTLGRDGLLCVSGRTGDVINRGGHKVSAAVLEEVLVACAGVKDGGVCGVVGDSGINEIWVGIVPETTIDTGRLKQTLESNEKFNTRVDEILILDSVPRNELGKIKRHELRDKFVAAKKNCFSRRERFVAAHAHSRHDILLGEGEARSSGGHTFRRDLNVRGISGPGRFGRSKSCRARS